MDKINEELNKIMKAPKTIYVLKGFNLLISKLNLIIPHIFDLKINEDLINIFDVKDREVQKEMLEKLNEASYYCLYEELLYIEKKNYIGLIPEDYIIKIIDIGCFSYKYSGLKSNFYENLLNKIEDESSISNILQKIYSSFKIRNNLPIVEYNNFDSINRCEYMKLYNTYSLNYSNKKKEELKRIEISDNASDDDLIELLNNIINLKCDCIDYIVIENKENESIKKFLFMVNEFFEINIYEQKDKKDNKLPELYLEYESILKRIDKSFKFKDIDMYENPFESNKKIKINQSIIIDTIYQNILKAQNQNSPKDIFVTAPTGAGKSILFQIPAIMAAERNNLVTIVISPLIALMKDQINNIKQLTTCAETINSEYTPFEKETVKEKIKNGECSILYISPETLLGNYDISALIGDRDIGLLVIDEAHTVATWGKNFRPDYWYLGEYIDKLRHKFKYHFPIASFTATATISNGMDDMYHDIIESLNMTCVTFFGDVKRKNIEFDINLRNKISSHDKEKDEIVVKQVKDYINSDEKTLVYFPFIAQLNRISDQLPEDKFGKYYSRDLDKLEKDATLENMRNGKIKVVLATKAFGMGVDISDIKNVYHYAPTGNLADYVQEIGRAARNENMKGIAKTDYFIKDDFNYINKLLGLSQLTREEIIGVLKKIVEKYDKVGKRNFMVSTEDFAHVFKARNDSEIESNLKTAIVAIKRDLKYRFNFTPIIFKPRSMFTKGLFFISDFHYDTVKKYGWDKYLTIKYNQNEVNKISAERFDTKYIGNVYEFDFKKCWEDNYNDLYTGITFGNFKRKFYENDLTNRDTTYLSERMILKTECKYDNNFKWAISKTSILLNILKETFDEMKISRKYYTANEITEMVCKKSNLYNPTKLKNVMETLINLLQAFDSNTMVRKIYICKI